jgi:hypothetical protein
MRLIDGDTLWEKLEDEPWYDNADRDEIALPIVAAAPTVDAVIVTRCKDCKHFKDYGKTSLRIDGKNIKAGWCYRRARYDEEYRMPPDGFCSYGERKDGA